MALSCPEKCPDRPFWFEDSPKYGLHLLYEFPQKITQQNDLSIRILNADKACHRLWGQGENGGRKWENCTFHAGGFHKALCQMQVAGISPTENMRRGDMIPDIVRSCRSLNCLNCPANSTPLVFSSKKRFWKTCFRVNEAIHLLIGILYNSILRYLKPYHEN